jgi:hypothetical protein
VSRPLACGDRSGFLFAHACDRPAAGACSVCGKPICPDHTRMGAQGPTCITCLRDDDDDTDTETDSGDDGETAKGRGEDDPYFYGGPARAAAYYDADDYRAFDPTPDQPSGLETDTGAS